jgi:hypothetical protein
LKGCYEKNNYFSVIDRTYPLNSDYFNTVLNR